MERILLTFGLGIDVAEFRDVRKGARLVWKDGEWGLIDGTVKAKVWFACMGSRNGDFGYRKMGSGYVCVG